MIPPPTSASRVRVLSGGSGSDSQVDITYRIWPYVSTVILLPP